MSITDRQIARDLHELSRDYRVDKPTTRRLVIQNWQYPTGWQPSVAPLLIRFPDHYPRTQPAIYLPQDLEYTIGKVSHWFRRDTIEDHTGQWVRWCTHAMPWERDLEEFLTHLIQPSLNRPHTTNPVRNA